jgi:hypothetical protein
VLRWSAETSEEIICLSCTLGLAWRLADGWVSPLNLYLYSDQAPAAQARIDEAARSVGRAPSAHLHCGRGHWD